LSVLDRRYANIEILIYPVKVQGEDAKCEITEAIEYLNAQYPELDVILAGRGGGSYEDLWAFNEELVARAIYKSRIPIISCVGHEIDFTIADFVADLRAPTPSAAAELVVKNKHELVDKIELLDARLARDMDNHIERYEDNLNYLLRSKGLEKPEGIFEIKMQRLDEIFGRLQNAAENMIERAASELGHAVEKMKLISPLNVLERGYSICAIDATGNIVTDSGTLKTGESVKVTLHKGGFKGIVGEIMFSEKNS
jgi:exodeoxyribonuclease VII large subunit